MNAFRLARALALALPVALMAGALGSQYIAGLYPCEMCHWQRWPHYAAIVLAALAFVVPGIAAKRTLVALAAFGIAVSGAIGVFHAGVEYHWWEGITACTTRVQPGGGDFLDALLKAPIIRCDVAQWSLGGISLAGFNAIFSLGGAVAILALLTRRR
ncbi:disulfide bond formation protein B [Sphingomonas qomolangmaensis]|uniref:Disulfide bond formation protein B n=1 Tax=Sphingomonas qomolangmaensis TaxID=2918765 RepID=A0ABY5L844_9SPHN|nr:disulfide bond formation protein B [Sphingomonas qomolangmaensis]UUL81869.1 disulfide bond formation protein B [Sphingomonas qomolangmaensis]